MTYPCAQPPHLTRSLHRLSRHGDTVLMCLSASQIIYSFIMMPSTLPSSYVRFLNKAAAKEPWVWKAVQVRRDTADNGCIHSQGLSQSAELTLPPDRQRPDMWWSGAGPSELERRWPGQAEASQRDTVCQPRVGDTLRILASRPELPRARRELHPRIILEVLGGLLAHLPRASPPGAQVGV